MGPPDKATSEASAPEALTPDWDMTPFFDALGSASYRGFRASLDKDVAALLAEASGLDPIGPASTEAWALWLERLEDANARAAHLASYLQCLASADARDEAIQAETASVAAARAELAKAFVAARSALGACDADAFEALRGHARLESAGYFVERMRRRAEWSMEDALEGLASDLDVTGLSAWSRLYDQTSGNLEFDLEVEGRPTRRLPVSMTRSLLEDPDPAVRRAAFDGGNRAWESRSEVFAACLNAIAGTRLTLDRRRGVPGFLAPALFDAGITQATLDAMFEAVRDRQEVARRFLRGEARRHGRPEGGGLPWWDLTAPPATDGRGGNGKDASLPWEDARERVVAAFGAFEPELGRFGREAFDGRWIDYGPRPGKRPGGFCATSPLVDQSRIFLTYQGALGDMATLAHELGHAYHGRAMSDLRPWCRRVPMTLAETASTFAEQVAIDAALEDPATPAAERRRMLHGRLQSGVAFLLDIPTRFDFERDFYTERADGEVGVGRLCTLMQDAQRANFGDALDAEGTNPWFWASKLHFFLGGIRFYNFPYTFGFLFAQGLYAVARAEPDGFWQRYRALLRRTGSAPAEVVAREALGVDLETPAFWNASIDGLEADLESYEREAA